MTASSGQAQFMRRARELGACAECCYERHATVVKETHPDCYNLILTMMEERYGHVPRESLRQMMFLDGLR